MRADTLLSIIIPVKNEQANIAWVIEKIKKTVKVKNEILIIYDSPRDSTLPIAKKLKATNSNLTLVENSKGDGVFNAIEIGIERAKGEIIVIMAADRTDDPKTIDSMYQKIIEGYDIVCPTRYSKGGKVVGPSKRQVSTLKIIGGHYSISTGNTYFGLNLFFQNVP